MAAVEFVRIENSTIRSAVPENPVTKHEVDQMTGGGDITT